MEIPQELAGLSQRLEDWRSHNAGPRKLPAEFWSQAAELGQRYGFTRVSRVLRMNAAVLRGKCAPRPNQPRKPQFVEVPLPPPNHCTLELDTPRGKLRVELRQMPIGSLAELLRALSA